MNRLQNPPKKSNGCIYAVVIILIVLVVAPVSVYIGFKSWYTTATTQAPGDGTQAEIIEIVEGEGLLDIAPSLVEKGFLSDVNALRLYLYFEKPEVSIHVGDYQLDNGLNIPALIEKFNAGPIINSFSFTTTEGLRKDEVISIITKKYAQVDSDRFKADEYKRLVNNPDNFDFSAEIQSFLDKYKPVQKSLEGFLFPDTYVVGIDASALEVVELQISTLIRRLEEANINPDKSSRAGNFYKSLNLASIIEREARQAETKRIVGDIFLKRLERNEVLAADSTYLYAVKDWKYPLTNTELRTNYDNKYNTYVYAGLPPTPIGSPGIDALKGVYNPKKNPYYYFLTDANGVNRYAKTLSEHQQNINTYL